MVGRPRPRSRAWLLRNDMVRHDVFVIRGVLRSFSGRIFDLMSLILVIGAFAVFLRGALWALDSTSQPIVASGAASMAAASLDVALRQRLAFFRAESIASTASLFTRQRTAYRLLGHSVASVLTSSVVGPPRLELVAIILASWWGSVVTIAVLALVCNRPAFRRRIERTSDQLSLRRPRPFRKSGRIAFYFVIILVGMTAWLIPDPYSFVVACGAALAVTVWKTPMDYAAINYQRLIGYSCGRSIWHSFRHCIRYLIGLPLAALLGLNVELAAAVLITTLSAVLFLLLYLLLSRLVRKAQVQFFLVFILMTLLSAALAAPFLLPIVVPVVIGWLIKKGNQSTWKLA